MNARAISLLALVLVAVAVGAVAWNGGSEDRYIVKAEFHEAGGVRKNSDVKIGEVPAGRVTAIDLTERDTALVTMELDDGVGPVGRGAEAQSRPVNLLGEKYIDLDPGNLLRPVASGSTIPAARTATAVELDDILNTLQPDTRARLRILINEAGIAMAGRGSDFNAMLEQLPAGLDEASAFLGALSRDTDELKGLVERGDRVLAAVTAQRTQLGRLIRSADAALEVTSSRRAALGRTLATAPAGLAQLRGTLAELRLAGDDLRPAAAKLRKAAGPLASTLQALPAFAEDARGTLVQARKVAPALHRLGTQAAPTVRRLRPTLDRLADFTGTLAPLTAELSDGGAVKALVRFANNWAGLTTLEDGLSHIFRVRLLVGPDSITGEGSPKEPAKRSRRVPRRPPAEPGGGPSAPKADARPAPAVKAPVIRLPDAAAAVGEVTKKLLGPEADTGAAVDELLKGLGSRGDDDLLPLLNRPRGR
ncbi:MAG TPA: MlaD family protein [Baekduia sp.]|nr:MlaD family protein [Baekduia sp.]